jgi:hypothetical protein
MKLNAEELVNQAATFLPGIDLASKLLGLVTLNSLVKVLRKAVESPEYKADIIRYLRYIPGVTGHGESVEAPALPEGLQEIREDMDLVKMLGG